jgi:anti-sigma factor RsiW
MIAATPSWETLNAYVDGELSAAEAAAVARALADNRQIAEQVAALTRLKAAVLEGMEPAGVTLPAPKPRRWRPLALAASLAAAMVLGTIGVDRWQSPAAPAWMAGAWEVHRAWAAAPGPSASPDSGVVLAAFARLGPKAYFPDLAAAKLTLDRIVPLRLRGLAGEALHVGYRGTRGCRISLLVLSGAAALPVEMSMTETGGAQSYAWRSGTHGYLLLAKGMDGGRVALIAESLRRATLDNSPFGPETRSALKESRETSAPCLS